jgi:hypothetical protein
MFKRVIIEDWAVWSPFIAFFIFFVIFLLVTVRALRLGKTERERLAAMPLENTPASPQPETTDTP